MIVKLKLNTDTMSREQRFLLRELFNDVSEERLQTSDTRAPENQKSPTIVDAGKTEIVGISQLEGFVPPKRGRKPKGAVEIVSQTDVTAEDMGYLHPAMVVHGEVLGPEITADFVERVEPPPLVIDPAVIGGEEEFVAEPVVTDKDLHNACAAKMAKGVSAGRQNISTDVRALIGEYVQAGQGVAMIPQPARAGFIERLAAL